MKNYIHFSPEVRKAQEQKMPIVALESTIISHGMPYPQNLEVAIAVEEMVRDNGAMPATIAIIDGQFHIGLTPQELETFAAQKDVLKCSRRDLPYMAAKMLNGATTVAATMMIAEMGGIKIFATGGIGGVHRQAETTFDISADLIEFSRTQVAVVSAGAKAILDLPKTLEYLETHGVPVIGYQTDFFPAFYNRSSGLPLATRLDTASEIATLIQTNNALGQKGILITNPIPHEFELNLSDVENAIRDAIEMAKKLGVTGKELTPFLLKKMNDLTKGDSQKANTALILSNARLAAQIACCFCK